MSADCRSSRRSSNHSSANICQLDVSDAYDADTSTVTLINDEPTAVSNGMSQAPHGHSWALQVRTKHYTVQHGGRPNAKGWALSTMS